MRTFTASLAIIIVGHFFAGTETQLGSHTAAVQIVIAYTLLWIGYVMCALQDLKALSK